MQLVPGILHLRACENFLFFCDFIDNMECLLYKLGMDTRAVSCVHASASGGARIGNQKVGSDGAVNGVSVQVQFFGSFAEAADRNGYSVDVGEGAFVFDLLVILAREHGARFRDELFSEPDILRNDVMVAVNGAIVNRNTVETRCLNPGDTVALFPVFPGGG